MNIRESQKTTHSVVGVRPTTVAWWETRQKNVSGNAVSRFSRIGMAGREGKDGGQLEASARGEQMFVPV